VADWFEGTSAAEVAEAVKAVEREAAVTIADQDAARAAAYRDRVEITPPAPQQLPQGHDQAYPGRDDAPPSASTYQPPGPPEPYGPGQH